MLALTGLRAALAAEIVSLWICINVPFFDFLSTTIGIGAPIFAVVVWGGGAVEEAVVDAADDGTVDDGWSDVIRSISVVPEESCTRFF